MSHITILSCSVRTGRASHRVALHLERSIAATEGLTAELIDLQELAFPLFEERLKFMPQPDPAVVDFAQRIRRSDGVVLVCPEYNGSFPASLKNVIDLLTEDWKGKPVSLCVVSGGAFGGSQVLTQLLFTLWKIKAWVMTASMQVPKVQEAFSADGTPTDVEGWERRTKVFLDDLSWAMEAKRSTVA